jgi:AcrR family transcriptional regulator
MYGGAARKKPTDAGISPLADGEVILSVSEDLAARLDRRAMRTRTALIGAFNHLALNHRKNIRVADIVALANVGRSTFYEHFRSADDIHLHAMQRPFALLADAAAGMGDEARLTGQLEHFWENRQLARTSVMGRMHDKVNRLLAAMIEERMRDDEDRLAIPLRLATMQLAEAALAPIRGWVTAEAPCTADALAGAICRCGRAMRAALAKEAGGPRSAGSSPG